MKMNSPLDLRHIFRSTLSLRVRGADSRENRMLFAFICTFALTVPILAVMADPPKVIKATPDNGATDVDFNLKEIRVTFDQDMTIGPNYSWVGGGPTYPGDPSKQPRWIDARTCVLPVQIQPNSEYWVSVNNERYQNFRSESGEPAEPYPIQFKTCDFKTPPPKVIKAVPNNGDTDVDYNLKEIRITFDQDMITGENFSWVGGGETFPETTGTPKWIDQRTCVLPVKLKTKHEYALSINSQTFTGFKSKIGQPAEPYPIAFKTAEIRRRAKPTPETAKMDAEAIPVSIPGLAKGWSEEKRLVTTQDLQRFHPAVGALGDDVFVAYREGALKVIVSRDGGKTWAPPVVVSGDLKINSAPSIATTGNEILIVWPSIVEVENIRVFQLHEVHSSNAGATWSKPRRITTDNNDDCRAPRLLPLDGGVTVVWQQTPAERTLGGVDLNQRADWTPDSVQAGIGKFETGSVERGGLNVRVTIYCSSYSQDDKTFTPSLRIGEVFARQMPNIFQLYGPEDGSVFLTYNKDAEVKTVISVDRGRTWKDHFGGREYFDPQTLINAVSTPDGRRAAWIRLAPYQSIPINFRDTLDRPSTSLTAPYYVRTAPNLAVSDKICHIVWSAGQEDTSWISYMRTDDIRPTTRITSPTSPHITGPVIPFAWKGNDNISDADQLTYSNTIDKQQWSPFDKKSSANVDTPPDGEYTLRVRAMDVAGNIQEPPSELKFDSFGAAPDTEILGIELNKTTMLKAGEIAATPPVLNQRNCLMLYTGKDNTQRADELTYSVQLDDGDWSEFTSDQSREFRPLANGKHTLRVRAKDARDNIDASPAEISLVVKIGLEVRFIEPIPPKYSNAEETSFSWQGVDDTGNENVDFSYYSRLDGGEPQKHGSTTQTTLTDLKEGDHTFTIWAVDPAGNQTPEASFDFLIDRTPPDTFARFEYRWSNGGFPIATLEGTDPPVGDKTETKPVRFFQYHLGDGAWEDLPLPGGTDWVVGRQLPFYSWGFRASVRAADPSGNFDPTPAVVNLTLLKRFTTTTYAIVGGVVGVIVIVLLWLMLRGRSRRRPMVSTPSSLDAYSTTTEETEETPSYKSSLETDSEKKSDSPFDY
ncbi:MAG: hypothetical protein ABIH23_22465 [bacterium]